MISPKDKIEIIQGIRDFIKNNSQIPRLKGMGMDQEDKAEDNEKESEIEIEMPNMMKSMEDKTPKEESPKGVMISMTKLAARPIDKKGVDNIKSKKRG